MIVIFDLCIDNFDGLNLEENHPKLYSCLKQLHSANKKKPLIDSLKENSSTIHALKEIFATYKGELRVRDCQLYYALLNFMDFLKTHKVF
ncbi:MAG: hypothetical protein HFJ28_07140 [Clostridia bacterium]|nr:hypothetical protein [Clostridia bacterium]